ncbi:putative phage protein [Escherichia coli]|nr:putative phage protein [Escherichia coli]GDR77085.1 putative phage protein [Escherichia coli]
MMKIEELREILSENGLYAVLVENGNIVSHCCIQCLQNKPRKSGVVLVYFADGYVTDGFLLREGEFVTSLQTLKEAGIKAGFSAFEDE